MGTNCAAQLSNYAMNINPVSRLVSVLVLFNFILSAGAQQVTIPDPGLNAAIRQALQKPTGPLTQQDLLSLSNLNAGQRNISSLQGLEVARNLSSLDLTSNHLANLSV